MAERSCWPQQPQLLGRNVERDTPMRLDSTVAAGQNLTAARHSHPKSQRRHPSGGIHRRLATILAGHEPRARSLATSSDAQNAPGGQGVAGSNPAVPTQVRGLIDDLVLTLGTTFVAVGPVWRILTAGQATESVQPEFEDAIHSARRSDRDVVKDGPTTNSPHSPGPVLICPQPRLPTSAAC